TEPHREDTQPPHEENPHHEEPAAEPQHDRTGAPGDGPPVERPDEPYLRDDDYRSDDPRHYAQIDDQVLEEGVRDNGELFNEQIFRQATELRGLSPEFAHMSDLGAAAVHSYTRHEVFGRLNEALRTGEDLHTYVGQAKAVVSGLNELPPYRGETVRTINFDNNQRLVKLALAHYEPGKVTVEPSFTSTKKVTPEDPYPYDRNAPIELRIRSVTGRDIEKLSDKPKEREVVHKPGLQLLVTDKRLVVENGTEKWVIHAEEITEGHPKYLAPETAEQAIHERRERLAADLRSAPSAIAAGLGFDSVPSEDDRARRTGPELTPEQRAALAAMRPPPDGWSSLNRATDPPGVPALHGGTVEAPQRQLRFIRDLFPQMEGINRGHYGDDPAFHRNGAETLLAYEDRVTGRNPDALAEPRPEGHPFDDPASQRDALRERLGGDWSRHRSIADSIDAMRDRPVGSRAVLSVEYFEPGPPPRSEHKVFAAVTTEHGVALLDPVRNRFAELPPETHSVGLLAHHDGEGPIVPHEESPRGAPREPSMLSRALDGEPVAEAPSKPVEHQRSIGGMLDGGPQPETPEAPAAGHRDIGAALGGEDGPVGYGAAEPGSWGAPPPDVPVTGDHDWSPLARATNPPSEPAIHAGTANANQDARYVAERHPELREVNPRFYERDAFDRGYQTNCTRSVVAYAQRLLDMDAHAEAVLPRELATKGTLEYVREQLGGQWESHGDYDSVIRSMREQPIGSHGVVGVLFRDVDGNVMGHVAMTVHTREGVAFIDPQSGRLMHLPHPPLGLDLLPFGSLEHSGGRAALGDQAPERPVPDAPEEGFSLEQPGVNAPEYDDSLLRDLDRELEILAGVEDMAQLQETPAPWPADPPADAEEHRPAAPRQLPGERQVDPREMFPAQTAAPAAPVT
ncbi:hypothetical protein FNH05_35825, partial [Amycolatopsis rhizosphaerae]